MCRLRCCEDNVNKITSSISMSSLASQSQSIKTITAKKETLILFNIFLLPFTHCNRKRRTKVDAGKKTELQLQLKDDSMRWSRIRKMWFWIFFAKAFFELKVLVQFMRASFGFHQMHVKIIIKFHLDVLNERSASTMKLNRIRNGTLSFKVTKWGKMDRKQVRKDSERCLSSPSSSFIYSIWQRWLLMHTFLETCVRYFEHQMV